MDEAEIVGVQNFEPLFASFASKRSMSEKGEEKIPVPVAFDGLDLHDLDRHLGGDIAPGKAAQR